MANVTLQYLPVEPVEPQLTGVTVELSLEEAQAVVAIIGHDSMDMVGLRQRNEGAYDLLDKLENLV